MIEPRAALEAIGRLPDAEIDIADAALQLARVDAPDADWQAARAHLSELARDAVALSKARGLEKRADLLGALMTLQHGYAGDTQSYDDLANANLIRVIQRRRGLPVALGIIWLHAARAAGWEAHGLDFPAHFLVGLTGRSTQVVIDPFHGGIPLDSSMLRVLLRRFEGSDAELRPGLLRPMSQRRVLLRLQNNIVTRRLQAGDVAGALRCTEDMLRIAPDEAELWRQAATLHQRQGEIGAALQCYERCLLLLPAGGAADRVRTAIQELRGRLN
jgi:regulator of sirC expression with transglutaminase-like and TPR domain